MGKPLPGLVILATFAALAIVLGVARKSPPLPKPLAARVAEDLDALRSFRRAAPGIPAGGVGHPDYAKRLERLRAAPPADLRALEDRVRDRREDLLLRVDLLQTVAAERGEAARRLCASLAGDPQEASAVRLAALSVLTTYRDPHTFDLLRGLWESPHRFEGRYHLAVALGDCGQPGAIPLLEEALAAGQEPELRAHAALALANFIAEAPVRERLILLVRGDRQQDVRENALRALARSAAGEVDALLAAPPEDLKLLAEALRRERGR